MNRIWGVIVFIFLVSCGPIKVSEEQEESGLVNDVNKESLSKIQNSVCNSSEQLVEVDRGSIERLYQTLPNYTAFGFVNGTSSCALKKDYNTNHDLSKNEYSVTLYDNCLSNGSLWTLKSLTRQNNILHAQLGEYGGNPNKVTHIKAHFDVKLRDLQSGIGFRVYKCTSK